MQFFPIDLSNKPYLHHPSRNDPPALAFLSPICRSLTKIGLLVKLQFDSVKFVNLTEFFAPNWATHRFHCSFTPRVASCVLGMNNLVVANKLGIHNWIKQLNKFPIVHSSTFGITLCQVWHDLSACYCTSLVFEC